MNELDLDFIGDFQNGLSLVSQNKTLFVVDQMGQKQFDFPYPNQKLIFSEGMAAIRKNNLYGIIDEKGSIIIDFKYNQLGVRRTFFVFENSFFLTLRFFS